MRPLRYIPDSAKLWLDQKDRRVAIVEITARTILGTFLLKPTDRNRGLFLGVLGRAQQRLDFDIYAYATLSNHYSMLVSIRSAAHLSAIMEYLHGNVAREIGHKKSSNWPGRFWGRRGRPILCLTDAAVADRIEYILSQGVKEHIVSRAARWPGPHCAKVFAHGRNETGYWINRSELREKERQARKPLPESAARTDYEIRLATPPCWRDIGDEAYREHIRELLRTQAREAAQERARTGRTVLGIKRVLRYDAHHRPTELDRSPAPHVHCTTREAREAFVNAYREFVGAFREAMHAFHQGAKDLCFPPAGVVPGAVWRHVPG